MMRFFGALADRDTKGTPTLPLDVVTPVPCPQPGLLQMARRAANNSLRSPLAITDALMRATPGIYQALEKTLKSPKKDQHSVPETRFNATVSPQKMFDATVFKLDDLKAVRPAVPGCTINDVVLAICSGRCEFDSNNT